MDYTTLGRTDIRVSRICLGTMTFGQQNTEAEGHAQMDAAVDAGVNFLDAAEMYPITPTKETQGDTERFIGTWLKARNNRDKVVIGTKATGPGESFLHIRGGKSRHTKANLEEALDGNLKRLQTDYVDLYQLHWPDRASNRFGQRGFQPVEGETFTPLEETLGALGDMVRAGKVRAIGLSNETPWGVMSFLALSDRLGLPRVATVQNPYSLLNRTYEIGLSEISLREDIGLLGYSPLACGTLAGKYLDGAMPEGARITLWPQRYKRYTGKSAVRATERYVGLARAHGLDPAQMAIAYLLTKPFLSATIIGATDMAQLAANIGSADLKLSAEVLAGIEEIQTEIPDPAP
ncbi:MAG: NADP(H)-dependent aldo-keto reductase [Rhodospirillales bacterium]|nr:NADP(H)-dependent aldo-keto reductase [Rhodospirillales bacterium]MCW8862544.1 NADP(H)-dependent aldo-keto reductase [Rhodospirillales bacterium]MCW8952027.1 NADP(H)-dependent aldo-keto reductase [Rhodospirillales bacterium]MCW8970871.1 NADP(H)-dependent aldo-keto reductase [Rhodospirillales bacterium]